VTVNQIVASKPAPLPENQVTQAATAMIQRRNLANELNDMVKSAKAEAGVDYQQGFAPPKTAATSAAEKAVQAATNEAAAAE
jgi:hypothetical protein